MGERKRERVRARACVDDERRGRDDDGAQTRLTRYPPPTTLNHGASTADGDAVAASLQAETGSRTFPQVFVGGKHVGGCDGEFCLSFVRACVVCAWLVESLAGAFLIKRAALSSRHILQTTQTTNSKDTMAAFQAGKLKTLLADAGISV